MNRSSQNNIRKRTCPARAAHYRLKHPARDRMRGGWRRILVPVDFSPASTSAIKRAKTFADTCGAEITLLHVIEPVYCMHDFGYGPVRWSRPMGRVVQESRIRLRNLAKRYLSSSGTWSVVVRTGTISEEIANVARELNIEMIIIPTRGRMPADQAYPVSMCARVIRQSPCPVLTLRKVLAQGLRAKAPRIH